ncbi:MAG: type II secretion system F family protein [Planctomycetota bacterium]|jgi:general secretion pathway protein F/type IV pilus assembly protein PilC
MPEYTYTARDATGEKVTGEVTASTQRDAVSTLAGRSLYPIDVRTEKPRVDAARVRRVPAQLRAITFSQMADLIKSGVPLLRAIEVLRKQTTHAGLGEVLEQIHHRVEDGATLAEAMMPFRRVFGNMAISMISAGGEGGFLEEVLERLAQFTEAQEDMKKRTIGAMAYPLFLACAGTVVVVVLLVFFVPKFQTLFDNLRRRGELPFVTEGLLAVSDWMWRYGLFLLAGFAVGVWALVRWFSTETGRFWLDRLKLRLPLVGKVFLSLAVARFCRVLGTLLRNGVPIVRSLEISSGAAGNTVLGQAIQKASENISGGESLASPLGTSGHFPPTVVEMISVAEESNTLETVLINIADSLERRTWRQLDIVVRLLEPIMLLLLAAVVLVVLVALLLPMFNMSTAV